MLEAIRVWLSARRMGLRDKGKLEIWSEGGPWYSWVHAPCKTRLRVGIDDHERTVKYCWRCECETEIIADPEEPDPGEEVPTEPTEAPEPAVHTADTKVLKFPHKAA